MQPPGQEIKERSLMTMDLSFLPASSSEYKQQRTGTRFNVRSANSPSYGLTRRPGIRKRETFEGAGQRGRHRVLADTNYTNKEEDAVTGYQARIRSSGAKDQSKELDSSSYQAQTTLNLNNTADKPASDSAANEGENHAFEGHGRTEWKKYNLPRRSRSLDRTGARSPAPGTKADTSTLQAKEGAELSEQAQDLEGQTPAESGLTGRLTSALYCKSAGKSYAQDKNSVGHTGKALDWAMSLPSSFRSESGSRFKENLLGSKGGQSIRERIDKLYGSTGEMAAGGTFPRRFSSCERNNSMESKISLTWKDTPESETSLFPKKSTAEERAVMGHLNDMYSEEANRGKAWVVGYGTHSLDRVRSRHTLAAQIRSGRVTGGTSTKPSAYLEDIFKGSSEVRAYRESGATEESRANREEEKSGTSTPNRILREKTKKVEVPEEDKRTGEIAQSDAYDEEVFETNPLKNPLKTAERRKPQMQSLHSATSVKNKISQFEALTQRAGQISLPRRIFSVPTQLSKLHDGVKKSKSAKEIGGQRDKQEGLKEGREEDGVVGKGTKQGSVSSFSVDEIGLGLGKTETGGNDLLGESKINFSEDFGKYSKLKATLQLPLTQGAQGHSGKFNIDETVFYKASSSDEFSKKVVSSPQTFSDDDQTPTKNPRDSPFLLPTQPENTTLTPDNKITSDAARAHKTEDPDSTSLPVATSFHSSSSDPLSADVRTTYPKGKRQVAFLNAWIAGLNQDYDCWDAKEKDYEDDDDDSTQMDEDSNYDSDSGDSSVTITSNMSQSERRSYSLSLSDLCNFTGAESESNADFDEGQSIGQRSASLCSEMSAFSCVSLLPTEELDRLLEDVRTLGDDALQDNDDVQVVVLHKEVGVGLGFSLAGGADQNKPITVHKVFHSGIAAQEGSIKEGDFVLSINGTALSESAHWEALRVLKRAKTQEMGVVVLRRGDESSALKTDVQQHKAGTTQTQYKTGQRVCVQLKKNTRDLGFSLQGGVGSKEGNIPLTIQKIFQGGPVDKVYPGDEVLEIQGVSMMGKRRLEAWTFIKSLPPGLAEVVLHRPTKHVQT